jgi:hypothetical protein
MVLLSFVYHHRNMGFVPFAGKIKVISGVSNLYQTLFHKGSVFTDKLWALSEFSSALAVGVKTASAGKVSRKAKLKANIEFFPIFTVFHRK